MYIGRITAVLGWRSDDAAGRTIAWRCIPAASRRCSAGVPTTPPGGTIAWRCIPAASQGSRAGELMAEVMLQPALDAAGAHHHPT